MTFEIGELHPNTPHLFSDLIELSILVNGNGQSKLSESDIESLIRTGVISPEENDIEIEDDFESDISSAEKNDKAEERVENIFRLLEYRQGCFGDFYPFQVLQGEFISLKKPTFIELTAEEKLYVILLACSRLRSFKNHKSTTQEKSVVQLWAKYFTELGKVAFQSLLPEWANVHIFDANSDDRRNIFGTNLNAAGMNTIVGYVYDMLYGNSGGYPSYASAAALILFAIVLTITVINLLLSTKGDEAE